jgi:hypothetical protein
MSKRPRAARSTKRPRPQSQAVPRPAAPAAAAAVATAEPALPAPSAEPRPAPGRLQARTTSKPSGLLAQRAANEYVYVARDLRRISVFAGGAAAVLAVVWVFVDLLHVVAL